MNFPLDNILKLTSLPEETASRWPGRIEAGLNEDHLTVRLYCPLELLAELCGWLFSEEGYGFATLIVEEQPENWLLRYVFYGELGCGQVHVLVRVSLSRTTLPSISLQVHAADWREREVEDLYGLKFEGHPRLGDFVLHEQWPEGVNPMRADFDGAKPFAHRQPDVHWQPGPIVEAPGVFMMPIGPVYSDYAESAHFLLETVGEDVIRTIPRFFYKYRGVEKIAVGRPVDRVLLLAERFSGTSAFAHSMAFCQAVEDICAVDVPLRAMALRVLLAEVERLRHHVAAIAGICSSTALAVAASQAAIMEEELLRLTGAFTGHRYLFGLNIVGGLSRDFADEDCRRLAEATWQIVERLKKLAHMLRFTSSFLDRLEEVGRVSTAKAISYGLVGPVARASGLSRDLREVLPYGHYDSGLKFMVPRESEGDGYARLRTLFSEAEQAVNIIRQVADRVPGGSVTGGSIDWMSGCALGWAEAPAGAAFHWVRLAEDGQVNCYHLRTPAFTNWHGFHLAAENFAFQDFPIIMATFALSNAECDR